MARKVQGLSQGRTAGNWVGGGPGTKVCVNLEPVCWGCSRYGPTADTAEPAAPGQGVLSLGTDFRKRQAPGTMADHGP